MTPTPGTKNLGSRIFGVHSIVQIQLNVLEKPAMMVTENLRANASHHVVHTYMSLKNSCLKASFALGVTEIVCMAHARRKFYELHTTKKSILAQRRCSTSLLSTRLSAKFEAWSLMSDDEYVRKKQLR